MRCFPSKMVTTATVQKSPTKTPRLNTHKKTLTKTTITKKHGPQWWVFSFENFWDKVTHSRHSLPRSFLVCLAKTTYCISPHLWGCLAMILLQLQFQGEPEGMGDWVSITLHPGFHTHKWRFMGQGFPTKNEVIVTGWGVVPMYMFT